MTNSTIFLVNKQKITFNSDQFFIEDTIISRFDDQQEALGLSRNLNNINEESIDSSLIYYVSVKNG